MGRTNPQTDIHHIVASMDTGIDDALALALLLAQPDVRLHGVSASYGNVLEQQAARNTRAVLSLLGRSDIPVFDGARHPSWAPYFIADAGCAQFHGSDGLGDVGIGTGNGDNADFTPTTPGETLASDANGLVTLTASQIRNLTECGTAISVGGYQVGEAHADLPTMPELTIPSGSAHIPTPEKLEFPQESCSQATAGARMIVDAARRFGPDLTILATGPLTDIDTALTLDPEAVRQARIVFMGGTLTQEGNCYDLVCETNMIQDPEAADRVLRSGADVTMVGLDVTHRCLLGSSDITPWNAAHTGASRFLTAIAEFSIRANAASDPIFAAGMPLHDPLAAAVALDSTLVGTLDLPMCVETRTGDGTGVRGRTIGNPQGIIDASLRPTHVAVGVARERFLARFTGDIANLLASRC